MSNPAHQGGSYSGLPNLQVSATNGINYAYRDTSPGNTSGIPLVLLQRFRGNLDNWDPVLIDALAPKRRVLTLLNILRAGTPTISRGLAWADSRVQKCQVLVLATASRLNERRQLPEPLSVNTVLSRDR